MNRRTSATATGTTPTRGTKAAFARRLKEARIGDVQAQYEVAVMLASGKGAPEDLVEAHSWFLSAARRGHAGAQYLLGVAYASGVGVSADAWEAFRWFYKAQEQGNANATYQLARLLDKQHQALRQHCWQHAADAGVAKAQWQLGRQALAGGAGTSADAGLDWLRRAAAQGLAEAQLALGVALSSRADDDAALDEAVRHLRDAAAQGMASAYIELAALRDSERIDDSLPGLPPDGGRRRPSRALEERLHSFAQHGSAENQYHLGVMHEKGLVVGRNADKALHWYTSAAQRGDALAQLALGRLLAGTDAAASARWYGLAAAQGQPDAQWASAQLLAQGVADRSDPLAAHQWLARAAAQDHPAALAALAEALAPTQPALALACTRKAAEAGHAPAQHRLALALHRGDGTGRDQAEAVRWMTRAAEAGHAPAQVELAAWHEDGDGVRRDPARAATWYAQAVDSGDGVTLARAQWALGKLLATGAPGLGRDVKRATLLCRKAAGAGFAPAQATMGLLMAQIGEHHKALRWWDKAAEQGDAEAQYNLGMARLEGRGAAQDPEVAFTWLMHAAECGMPVAQQRVGFAYATGLGVPQDLIEATKWFSLAEAHGNAEARANLQRARGMLSAPQWAEARRRAEGWEPKARTGR